MLSLLRTLLPLFNVAALALVTRRRRLLRTLRSAGADTESRATPMESTGLTGWWLRRLGRSGVVRRAEGERYWLDTQEYSRYRRERLLRALVVLVIVIAVWVISTTHCCTSG